MTTRTGARIYRGPTPAPLADGACPHCGRVVAINPNGQRRHHQTSDGIDCTGSGIHIDDEHGLTVLTELPPVVVERAGNPWSGRADIARRDTP